MNARQEKQLWTFAKEHRFVKQKGALCVALVVTRKAIENGLPLQPEQLKTARKGQVAGLSRGAVQKILSDYGISRVLAKEGGRTSRGSLDNMTRYVGFLNDLEKQNKLDLKKAEEFWVSRVREFFAGKPFQLKLDRSESVSSTIRQLLDQARIRQKEQGVSMQYLGAMMQHLVGAKLDIIKPGQVKHHSFSTADQQSARMGDFELGDTVVHVTSSPTEALIRFCKANLEGKLHPVIVTHAKKVEVAQELAEQQQLKERIDIFPIEQFMAANIYEIGKFEIQGRYEAIAILLEKYNTIIDQVETDPSLKVSY